MWGSWRLVAVMAGGVAAGCGRYRPPLPPEALAPQAVESLQVTGTTGGVRLTWAAPEKDRRGKELQEIEGYSIQRKEIKRRGDETDPSVDFDDIGFVKDTHVEVREQMRAKAREEGKIGRTVKPPEELTLFSFSDTTAATGSTYVYQVVPENQGGVEGRILEVAKVVFKGDRSDIIIVPAGDVDANADPLAKKPIGDQ